MSDKQVGNVEIKSLKTRKEKFMYSDGDEEERLLSLFKNGLTEQDRINILNNNPSWAFRYHLSYDRGNLIDWYDFKDGARVLEIGSGCGAITEALVRKNINIVSNELSERRATINAHRNKESKNLEIIVGNLQDYKPKAKFDYVVCVGVLEYAGTFIHTSNPYHDFISLLSGFLKDGGTLLLAIENKLGMKYLSGAREDHTRRFFDGINNYPQKLEVKTFGKVELAKLFEANKFSVERFYYPFPDYKLPQVIYSDDYLPGINTSFAKGRLPSPSFDQPREYLFSEQQFTKSLEENKIYDSFANSFLVEAIKASGDASKKNKSKVVFSQTATSRSAPYRIRTKGVLGPKDESIYFVKEALSEDSVAHINRMKDTYKTLVNIVGKDSTIKIAEPLDKNISDAGHAQAYRQIKGDSLDELLLEAILNLNLDEVRNIIDKYNKVLGLLSSKSSGESVNSPENIIGKKHLDKFSRDKEVDIGLLDINFDNIIVDEEGQWWLIDYEWRFDVSLPADYLSHRAFYYFFLRYRSMICNISNRIKVISNNIAALPKILVDEEFLDTNKLMEAYLIENKYVQPLVCGFEFSYPLPSKFSSATEEVFFMERSEARDANQAETINALRMHLDSAANDIKDLERHISTIRTSKSYKIGLAFTLPARELKSRLINRKRKPR